MRAAREYQSRAALTETDHGEIDMAVSSNSRRAPGAHPFDAADWLRRFAIVGGWWIAGSDGRVSLGWMIEGYSIAENAAAAALWRETQADPAKVHQIRVHLSTARHSERLAAVTGLSAGTIACQLGNQA